MNWDDSFGIISFNYSTTYPDDAYVISNLESDKTAVLLYDLKEDKVIKEIFAHPGYDLCDMGFSRKRNYEIDYFGYQGEKTEIVPVSELYKKIDAGVREQFPGKIYGVADHDDDENTFLIVVQSDRLYGTYYEYNVNS